MAICSKRGRPSNRWVEVEREETGTQADLVRSIVQDGHEQAREEVALIRIDWN